MLYAERKIKSGRMLEVFLYPVQKNGHALSFGGESREAQKKYNDKRSARSLVQLVNANFDTGDIWMHPTFAPEEAPSSLDEARRIIGAYFRRVDYWRKKHDLPKMRYIYVIEEQVYKTGKYAGLCNYHYHLWMSAMPQDAAEELWSRTMRVNAMRFQPDRFGQEAAARYVTKAPRGIKKWVCSRNCVRPVERDPVHKDISARKLRSMAEVHIDDAAYWERRCPGYNHCETEAFLNPYNARWYMRVVYRRPAPDERSRAGRKKRRATHREQSARKKE